MHQFTHLGNYSDVIKATLRNAAYAVAPGYVVDKYLHYKMLKQARAIAELRDSSDEPSGWIDELSQSHFFRPLQKKSEILRLLKIIRSLRPKAVCEIGAAGCGTTFLLTQAAATDALLITLDLAFTTSRAAALESFALPEQQLVCLKEDSHASQTLQLVKRRLAGQQLDVLYLDGDHSYEGIKTDFELYRPLVRPGGLIVFHDIVPDSRTRYGIRTSSDVGEVPKFWQEIKSVYASEEIVEDYEQDGFGIGVLYWQPGEAAGDV
jgi:predicted O-methyltransferase YrrM